MMERGKVVFMGDAWRCAHWRDAPADCPHEVFESGDGSTRCRGCHLHPDGCTCGPTRFRRLLELLGLVDPPDRDPLRQFLEEDR